MAAGSYDEQGREKHHSFDPSKNGGRVLLANPGDCQETTQKKDWSVVIMGSVKRGGVGNALRGIHSLSLVPLPLLLAGLQ